MENHGWLNGPSNFTRNKPDGNEHIFALRAATYPGAADWQFAKTLTKSEKDEAEDRFSGDVRRQQAGNGGSAGKSLGAAHRDCAP